MDGISDFQKGKMCAHRYGSIETRVRKEVRELTWTLHVGERKSGRRMGGWGRTGGDDLTFRP